MGESVVMKIKLYTNGAQIKLSSIKIEIYKK